MTARQGETVSLRCEAAGEPQPSIAWHKSVGTAPGGHVACGEACYTIPSVDLATSGDYICSAVNGVGHPQHATVTLNVLCESENYNRVNSHCHLILSSMLELIARLLQIK